MKSCLKCKYADWLKTEKGRLHPSGDGQCKYPYKVPPLPASMYWFSSHKPSGGYINRRKELKEHCPYWQKGES